MQKITTELNDESTFPCVSISPYLTHDTLFIEEDFLPKEFNDFFAKWQKKNVVNDLGPYRIPDIYIFHQFNTYLYYVRDHGEEKVETKNN